MSVYSLTRQNIYMLTTSIIGMSALNSEGITVRHMWDQGCHLSFVIWLSAYRLLGESLMASHISMSLGLLSYYTAFLIVQNVKQVEMFIIFYNISTSF